MRRVPDLGESVRSCRREGLGSTDASRVDVGVQVASGGTVASSSLLSSTEMWETVLLERWVACCCFGSFPGVASLLLSPSSPLPHSSALLLSSTFLLPSPTSFFGFSSSSGINPSLTPSSSSPGLQLKSPASPFVGSARFDSTRSGFKQCSFKPRLSVTLL